MSNTVTRTDAEWKEMLSGEEYRVLRENGTEPAFSGPLTTEKRAGKYQCKGCSTVLFVSDAKFDSHCGWPSFWEPLAEDRVKYIEDRRGGVVRTEVRCATCDSHLGHVFRGEGYGNPTDARYCINSVCLQFDKK